MTNLLTGHEDYIVSHTRKEIMQKFNVNYNYINNFCNRNGIRPIAERGRYFVTDEMKNYLKEHTIKETAYKFHVGYNWLSIKVREMNIPCKRHRSEIKLSAHSCKRTGEAHDMIRYLAKTFTMASIARVFGYSRESIRQICTDNEEEQMKKTIYVLSWSKRENESHIEKYHSFFKWLKRIIQLLYKENTSVLIYKPYKE